MTIHFKKLTFVCTLLTLLSACSIFSPYGTSNWPDPAPLPTYKAQIAPHELWHQDVGSASRGDYLLLAPCVMNQAIYTIDAGGNFYATSLQGSMLWTKHFVDGGKSGVGSDGNFIAIVDGKGVLHVFNADHGKDKWQATLPSQALAAPTFTDRLLIIKTIDGTVTAFDKQTGQQLWQYEHFVPSLMLHASSAVLVQGDRALVGFSDGKVVALNIKDGEEVWTQQIAEAHGVSEIQRLVDIDSDLVLQNGKLFVATYQGQIAALNPTNGQILWQEPNSIYANIAVNANGLYALQADGTVTAYELNHGKQLWQQKAFAWRFLSGGTFINHYLVFGDMEGYVHLIDSTTGEPVGRVLPMKNVSVINAPLRCGTGFCVIDTKGRLTAYAMH